MMMIFTMVNDDGAPDVRLMPLNGSDLWEEDDGDDDVDDDDDDENTLYIDDLRIDDWSSILRSSILSVSTI